jgi:hypothetical protein
MGGIVSRGGGCGTSGQGAHAVAHAPNDCVGGLLLGLAQGRQPHQKDVDQVLTTLLSQRDLDRCLARRKRVLGFGCVCTQTPLAARAKSSELCHGRKAGVVAEQHYNTMLLSNVTAVTIASCNKML